MLRFRLFGIPVGVHATFLLIVVLGRPRNVREAVIWFAAAFSAILLHELGHAVTARAYGSEQIQVTLYAFGGLTSFTGAERISHGRRFFISAAGSAIGIVAGLAILSLDTLGLLESIPLDLYRFLIAFKWAALVWGLFNWVPIVPLDGGHMMQHLISIFDEERAPLIGQIVTWMTVAFVVVVAITNPVVASINMSFAAFIVVLFAAMGLRDYRAQQAAKKASTRPEIIAPAPPADPTPPDPPAPPPEFPI